MRIDGICAGNRIVKCVDPFVVRLNRLLNKQWRKISDYLRIVWRQCNVYFKSMSHASGFLFLHFVDTTNLHTNLAMLHLALEHSGNVESTS